MSRAAASIAPASASPSAATPDEDRWTIFVIPFSHNDIGWAGTPAEVAEHRARIIDDALALTSATDSDFRFSMEAALYLAEYLDRRPENAVRLRHALRQGRLEWGGAYVQCYEGLQTDEGLVRQFTLGRHLLEAGTGCRARGYWNVDVVARTLQLPQVLCHCGIEYMVISRNRPGMYWWQAPDGSRVLAFNFWEGSYGRAGVFESDRHHHSPLEVGADDVSDQPLDLASVRHRLHALADQWSEALDEAGLPHGLATVLAADYSVPDPAVVDLVRRSRSAPTQDGERQLELRIGTVGEYIDWVTEHGTLEQLGAERGEVPNPWVYQQPGHWEIVSQLRRGQAAILAAEALWTLVGVRAQAWGDYPSGALRAAWEDALYPDHGFGGLHGEGTDSVFHDRVNRGFFAAKRLILTGLQRLRRAAESSGDASVVVFNANDRPASDWLELPGVTATEGDGVQVTDAEGHVVDHQLVTEATSADARRLGIFVQDVPPFGVRHLHLRRAERQSDRRLSDPVRAAGQDVIWDTGDVLARVSARGLAELRVDGTPLIATGRYLGGEVIQLASPGVDVGTHEADPTYDWRIVRPFQPYPDGPVRPVGERVEVIERGPIRWTVQAVSRHPQCVVTQRFMFYPALDRIDLCASLTGWTGEHGRELRWIFPAASQGGAVRYGAPFGHVTVGDDEVEEFRDVRPREVLRWLMAGEEPATLALSTPVTTFDWRDPAGDDDAGSYLQLVLLATKRSIHPRGNWYGQEGSHSFTASVYLHTHAPAALDTAARQRETLWATAVADRADAGQSCLPPVRPGCASLIAALEPDHVVISAVKKHDDEPMVVIRLFEAAGQPASVRIRTGFPVGDAREIDGLESRCDPCHDLRQAGPDLVELSLRPWQIATLALTPEVGP